MKTFIGLLMITILTTIMFWHNYTNVDLVKYSRVRRLFFIAISVEIWIGILAILISMLNG